MAQLAMQQAMDEISDYLAVIDAKIDDVLRAQKDAVLADMIGVDLVIEEAMAVREQVGRVSDVTWSKVQSEARTIARTQAYAIRQLEALADKLERRSIADLAKAAKEARAVVQEWLAVLARCFQLQDALDIVELDRVMDGRPEELSDHRIGLRTARDKRLDLIARATETLLTRMSEAAGRANRKVLLNPIQSPEVVAAHNHVEDVVGEFRKRLGMDRERALVVTRSWFEAAGDTWDDVAEKGAEGLGAVARLGSGAFGRVRRASGRVADRITGEIADRVGGSRED
jgi:hypothetical protein